MFFDKRIVFLDFSGKNRQNVEEQIADEFYEKGLVTKDYKSSLLQRERDFPTGLMTQTIGVAIPHTDADKVIEQQIGFMRLSEPVIFHQMGDNQEIPVSFIFMLALKKSEDQLSMLQKLMMIFQDNQKIEAIKKAKDSESFIELMHDFGIDK